MRGGTVGTAETSVARSSSWVASTSSKEQPRMLRSMVHGSDGKALVGRGKGTGHAKVDKPPPWRLYPYIRTS